jgi:tRNA nucleotidyltransferase (CCA-adding enzyme)
MSILLSIDDDALAVYEVLVAAGHEAYFVGGAIRDALLRQQPKDWDIATSALPKQIIELFSRAGLHTRYSSNSLRHGTVTVILNGIAVEITTYRSEQGYIDGRHPTELHFISDINKDLARRDFSINSIAYSPTFGILDPNGGIPDLKNGVLRTIGNAEERLGEDALRIMRALRFSAMLGFSIDNELAESLHHCKEMLTNIAVERLTFELLQMLAAKNILQVLLDYPDVLAVFIPEITATIGFAQNSPYHIYDVWQHTAYAMAAIPAVPTIAATPAAPAATDSLALPNRCNKLDGSVDNSYIIARLALLFHDLGKPLTYTEDQTGRGHFYGHDVVGANIVEKRMAALRFPRRHRELCSTIVRYHSSGIQPSNIIRWLNRLGEECLRILLDVKRGDIIAHSEINKEDRLLGVANCQLALNSYLNGRSAYRLSDLEVNGNDILAMGVAPGPVVGKVLNRLLEAVIDGRLANEKSVLLTETSLLLRAK